MKWVQPKSGNEPVVYVPFNTRTIKTIEILEKFTFLRDTLAII